MNSDRINRWLTLGANIGVLIGLVLLVIEARHAINLSESDAYRHRGTEIQEAYQQVALSLDFFAAIMVKASEKGVDSLTPVENLRLSSWYTGVLLRMQNQFNDYTLGYLDETSYRLMLRAGAGFLPLCQELGVKLEDDFDPKFLQALSDQAS